MTDSASSDIRERPEVAADGGIADVTIDMVGTADTPEVVELSTDLSTTDRSDAAKSEVDQMHDSGVDTANSMC